MLTLAQSPTDPDFVQNPYPFYEVARADGGLFYWEDYGMICAVSHTACGAILRDRRFGRECPAELARPIPAHLTPFYDIEAHSMLELEPPRHTRLRGLVLRAFTSGRISALGPEIESLAHQLIDGLPPAPFDLITHFAARLPVIIIARLLGVPEARADDLLGWSNAMVGMYQAGRTRLTEDRAVAASRAFSAFLSDHVAARRARPADDLITHLIAAEADGESLSTEELISTCILLLNAGHEATVHTLGNGITALLDYRDTAATRGGDRFDSCLDGASIAATVEEILRYDPPLHMFTRWAYEDIEINRHQFRRGDMVGCLLAAANRAPQQWDEPERFDPTRPVRPHHAFGGGLHFCVGAPLARLELAAALRVLFTRLPGLHLAEPPRYADIYPFHGLDRLMVATR